MDHNQEMKEYQARLKAHDWYWPFSDDAGVCRAARRAEEELKELSSKTPDHKKLWEAWTTHISAVVQGNATNNVQPTWPLQDAVAAPQPPTKLKIPLGISGNSFIFSRQMAVDFLAFNRNEADQLEAMVIKDAMLSASTRTKIIHISGPHGADCLLEYCDQPGKVGEAFYPVVNIHDKRVCAARVSVPGQTSYFCTREQALAWVLLWRHQGLS